MSFWYKPTSPQSEPPWSPPEDRRSTFALVETCILTLILCSWTAIHLDIPAAYWRHSTPRWLWNRLKWSVVGILAPEYLLWMAFMEYWESRQICLELEKVKRERMEKGPPTDTKDPPSARSSPVSSSPGNPETHSTNGQIHNLNVEVPTHSDSVENTAETTTHNALAFNNLVPDKLEHGFYIEMGGYELVPSEGGEVLSEGFQGRVTSRGAIELYRYGQLPEIPLELINDQSKTDVLAKFVVCLQATWMVLQSFARVAQALPLTLLEINTIMHVLCALIMSCLWIKKPHDLIVPTKIPVDASKREELQKILDANTQQLGGSSSGLKLTESSNDKAQAVDLGSCRTSQYCYGVVYGGILGLFISTIYGGVHLAVWNGHFPTYLERVLWRISSFIILGMPFFLATFLALIWGVQKQFVKGSTNGNRTGFWTRSRNGTFHPTEEIPDPKTSSYWRSQYSPHVEFLKYLRKEKRWGWYVSYMLLIILQIIASLCYGFARAFLVVEAFASLRNLPVGSYNAVNWTLYIPHI